MLSQEKQAKKKSIAKLVGHFIFWMGPSSMEQVNLHDTGDSIYGIFIQSFVIFADFSLVTI